MDYKDLLAYKKSFALAMLVFDVSKAFPKEEKYSLTDQIRRSSRSVTITIAEAYRKREYPKYASILLFKILEWIFGVAEASAAGNAD